MPQLSFIWQPQQEALEARTLLHPCNSPMGAGHPLRTAGLISLLCPVVGLCSGEPCLGGCPCRLQAPWAVISWVFQKPFGKNSIYQLISNSRIPMCRRELHIAINSLAIHLRV